MKAYHVDTAKGTLTRAWKPLASAYRDVDVRRLSEFGCCGNGLQRYCTDLSCVNTVNSPLFFKRFLLILMILDDF